MRKARLLASAVISGFILAPALGHGAEVETGRPAASAADDATVMLEDVIVTAQRRSESLQRAAIAIDVVGADALVKNGVTSPLQLGALVPSLTVAGNGGSNTIFFVRGAGNFNSAFADPSIAFNYDGVYIGRLTSTAGLMYDLDRVEVLKGPQGTLYGRNATSGALNLIPTRPVAGDTFGFITGSLGNYQAANLQGAANIGLGDSAALRVSGNYSKHDGYLSDGTNDDDSLGLRAQLLAKITPDLTVRLAADYSHSDGAGGGASYALTYAFNPVTSQYAFTPAGFDRSVGVLDPRAQAFRGTLFGFTPGRKLGPIDPVVYLDNSSYGLTGEVTYDAGFGTLTVIPAYRKTELDNRPDVFAGTAWTLEDSDQSSLEARFDGRPIGIFDYLVGAYYFDESVDGNVTIAQDSLDVFQDYKSSTKSAAAFGRLTVNLTERFRLVGGIRYTHDDKTFDAVSQVNLVICGVRVAGVPSCPNAPVVAVVDTPRQLPYPVPAPNGPPAVIGTTGAISILPTTTVKDSLKTSRATYRAAVEFDLAPASMIYAVYETGFRSGGFSVAFGRESYEPEYITSYSVGSKNRLLDNRLQFNLEAFLWEYRNQQVIHTGIDGRGAQAQFTENVGSSTNKGVEIESRFLVTPNTVLSANILYLDAKYDKFVFRVPLGTAPPLTGCRTAINATNPAARDVDCSGKPSYNAPTWTLNLGAEQTVPLGDYNLVLSADTQYRSSRYVGFEYLPFQHVQPTWQTNAEVRFSPADDRWAVSAYVRNIEGDRQLTNTIILPAGSLATALTGPPRTYGIRATAKF